MIKKIFVVFCLSFFSLPLFLEAKTLEGVVRNIKREGSNSFGLDVPPMIRVYVNSGTKYQKTSWESLQVGDRVKVKGQAGQPGTFQAKSVKVLGHLAEKNSSSKSAIKVKPNQKFLLSVGKRVVVQAPGRPDLEIKGKEFINTLCQGRDCSGDGYVGMLMKLKSGGEKVEAWLRSQGHRKPRYPVTVQLGAYEVQLVETGEAVVLLVVR